MPSDVWGFNVMSLHGDSARIVKLNGISGTSSDTFRNAPASSGSYTLPCGYKRGDDWRHNGLLRTYREALLMAAIGQAGVIDLLPQL